MHDISNAQVLLCLLFSATAVVFLILGAYLILTGAPRARRWCRQLLCKHQWGEYACNKCDLVRTACYLCGESFPTTRDCRVKPGHHGRPEDIKGHLFIRSR